MRDGRERDVPGVFRWRAVASMEPATMSPLLANVRLAGQDDFVNVLYAKRVMSLHITKLYKYLNSKYKASFK